MREARRADWRKGGRSDCENCVVVPRSSANGCLETITSLRFGLQALPGRVQPELTATTLECSRLSGPGGGGGVSRHMQSRFSYLQLRLPGQKKRGNSSRASNITQRRLIAGNCIIVHPPPPPHPRPKLCKWQKVKLAFQSGRFRVDL